MMTFNNFRALFLALGVAVTLFAAQKSWAQNYDYEPSYDEFYDELSPYGDWMDYPSYGRVWRPRVEPDFQPYGTNGRWEMTEYGNTWVSDYPWGWAPFHYGRWTFDNYYGWVWIPGYEWGPAWVTWRSGGGYYGWAPLGPGMGLDINININIPHNYWVFVPDMYIRSPRVYSYCVPRNRISGLWGGTSYLNNYYRYNNRSYVFGPHRRDLERVTRNRVYVYRADDLYRNYRRNDYNRNDRYSQNNRSYPQRQYDNRMGQNNSRYNDRSMPQSRRESEERWENRSQNTPRRDDDRNSQGQRNDGRRDEGRYQQPQPRYEQPQQRQEQPQQRYEQPRGGAERTWQGGGERDSSPQRRSEGQSPSRSTERSETPRNDRGGWQGRGSAQSSPSGEQQGERGGRRIRD
ncbi:DUF6600 domain-containing protein [Runella sp. SP2]|uniref:DUF6600 domain-containing protein n=1 Tax=Runella sp. SP2 TaxID=2268026 RepID=UPI0013DE08F5|nr:DUF6600 domain-containing protein [Runella sp. SP2]